MSDGTTVSRLRALNALVSTITAKPPNFSEFTQQVATISKTSLHGKSRLLRRPRRLVNKRSNASRVANMQHTAELTQRERRSERRNI